VRTHGEVLKYAGCFEGLDEEEWEGGCVVETWGLLVEETLELLVISWERTYK
jgi:hypothetical protein